MDPEVAKRLLIEGGTLIFLDVPPGTEFGIDMNSWNIGEKFRGVKMIPPGLHFIFYSAANKEGNTAPRTGFFHFFRRGEILVKKWHKYNEDIDENEISDEEMQRFRANLKEIDRFLGAYPYSSWKKWVALTSHITESLVAQFIPLNRRICSVSSMIPDDSRTPGLSSKCCFGDGPDDDALLPRLCHVPGTEIRFSKFPEKRYPEGCTPGEMTRHSMDSTYVFGLMLASCYNNSAPDVLGELQFSFICFLVGQVYEAFEQWKKLVHMLCTCDDALLLYPTVFSDFISIMHHQIKEVPEDFFLDIVSSNNFLTTTFQEFFCNVETRDDIDRSLVDKSSKFKAHLIKKFKWDFSTEIEDFAPVVVDTGSQDS